MPANLHDKLFNLEVSPPTSAWEKISQQLDEEFDKADIRLSQKLSEATAIPPTHIWDSIAAAVPAKRERKRMAMIIPIAWQRVAVAAILLGFVATVVIYFANSGPDKPEVTVAINPGRSDSNEKSTNTIKEPVTPKNPLPAPTIAVINPPTVKAVENNNQDNGNNQVNQYAVNNSSTNTRNLSYSHSGYIGSIKNYSPININGPSIRDSKGHIIIDPVLVSAPNDRNYIIVTAPNGEQTRISSKFLYLLSSLNEPDKADYKDLPDWLRAGWKKRFNQWKEKIQQSSFVPSAGNFLDVLEFNELIRENQ